MSNVSKYKPLRHVKKGSRVRYYGESRIWVKGHTCGRNVEIHKIEDTNMSVSYNANITDTVEVVND